MIKPVTIYTAICDFCGKDICNGTGFSGWDMTGIENELSDLDWIKKPSGRNPLPFDYYLHYCPSCYSYDVNDNLILKEKQ